MSIRKIGRYRRRRWTAANRWAVMIASADPVLVMTTSTAARWSSSRSNAAASAPNSRARAAALSPSRLHTSSRLGAWAANPRSTSRAILPAPMHSTDLLASESNTRPA